MILTLIPYFILLLSLTVVKSAKQTTIKKEATIKYTPRLQAYVTDWAFPTSIAWNKLDHILYAFAVPDSKGNIGQFNEKQLQQLVHQAHENKKLVSLSIGGWTGSVYFSSLIRTSDMRDQFSSTLVNAVKMYDLDGLNLDWEYPNAMNGVSCNQRDPHDTTNLLTFTILLREKLIKAFPKEHKYITMAVAAKVFNGPDSKPSKQLSNQWAKVVDSFYIMAYDLRGKWDRYTGANAPIEGQGITINYAVDAWNKAGMYHHHHQYSSKEKKNFIYILNKNKSNDNLYYYYFLLFHSITFS
ncbi:unnamed protein product [Cunninghamella blakesleeana]